MSACTVYRTRIMITVLPKTVVGRRQLEKFILKVRNRPHNILFAIHKLACVIGKDPLLLQKSIS